MTFKLTFSPVKNKDASQVKQKPYKQAVDVFGKFIAKPNEKRGVADLILPLEFTEFSPGSTEIESALIDDKTDTRISIEIFFDPKGNLYKYDLNFYCGKPDNLRWSLVVDIKDKTKGFKKHSTSHINPAHLKTWLSMSVAYLEWISPAPVQQRFTSNQKLTAVNRL